MFSSRWRGGLRFKNLDEYFFRLTDGVWREAGRGKITQAPTAADKRKPTSQRGPAPYFSGYVQYIFPLDYNVSVILSFNFHACSFPQTRRINTAQLGGEEDQDRVKVVQQSNMKTDVQLKLVCPSNPDSYGLFILSNLFDQPHRSSDRADPL